MGGLVTAMLTRACIKKQPPEIAAHNWLRCVIIHRSASLEIDLGPERLGSIQKRRILSQAGNEPADSFALQLLCISIVICLELSSCRFCDLISFLGVPTSSQGNSSALWPEHGPLDSSIIC